LEQQLAEIKTPTLILWGRYDRLLDVSAVDVMRPLLPQAEVVIMEDTGHVPMIERPALTAQHYMAFIDKHD
ncbi:MAG: alpha/beta fold hydrolase, partial [Nevskiales bacterium]